LPELRKLEVQRKRLRVLVIGLWMVTVVVVLMAFAIGNSLESRQLSEGLLTGIGAISGIGLFGLWFVVLQTTRQRANAYVDQFKTVVISNLVSLIDPSLRYAPDACVSRDRYNQSGLFPRHWDIYRGDDHVSGTIGRTPVEFSELHTLCDVSGEDQRKKYRTVFRGLFFVCEFNKTFSGRTYVLPDKLECALGGIGAALQTGKQDFGQLVKLEDPEFERRFAVYGSDQIEARYILSTSLMARLVAFRDKVRQEVRISFVDSNLYVAIAYRRTLFEPRVWRTLLCFDEIQTYFDDLQLVIGIVQDLNLNTRIWGRRALDAQ
jgi:hypothetical protein